MDCIGLLQISDPVQFEPVGQLTNVFFDDRNYQVFSVRSNGATGITIKSPPGTGSGRAGTGSTATSKTLVLPEDGGQILSIKLSPDQKVLSLRRRKNFVDFFNVTDNGQLDPADYSVQCKNKSASIQDFLWLSNEELMVITDTGVDFFSIIPQKKIVKFLRNTSLNVSWFNFNHPSGLLITSPKADDCVLQLWYVKNNTLHKLPPLEVPRSVTIKEKEVSILNIYRQTFVRLISREGESSSSILLYLFENDSVALTYKLCVDISGPLGVQVLDNLVLVHGPQKSMTKIFDIGTPSSTKKESNEALVYRSELGVTTLTEKTLHLMSYLSSWVLLLPNIIVDARRGLMFTINLKLNRASSEDRLFMCRFLLNRDSGKTCLLAHLFHCVQDTNVDLVEIGRMFNDVVYAYHRHVSTGDSAKLMVGFTDSQYPGLASLKQQPPSVVLEQSDLFTYVFSAAEKQGVESKRLFDCLLQFLLSLANHKLQPRLFMQELLINLMVKLKVYFMLHQYLQYGVISDSKQIACILLSLQASYPAARQIAIDMLHRLGTAMEEMIEILYSEGKIIQALLLARDHGLMDSLSPRKYFEAAKDQDPLIFCNVFNIFEERNERLRGSPNFLPEDRCQTYVAYYKEIMNEATETCSDQSFSSSSDQSSDVTTASK